MIVLMLALALATLPSSPDLGKEAGHCRAGDGHASFVVDIVGFKDRSGQLKLELYPARDGDFLADDNVLVASGKAFGRVEAPVPATGPVAMCIRAPAPGAYALSVLHDRDLDRRFSLSKDGIGFSGNPVLGWSKPAAGAVRVLAGPGVTHLRIRLNYRRGLMSMRPIGP